LPFLPLLCSCSRLTPKANPKRKSAPALRASARLAPYQREEAIAFAAAVNGAPLARAVAPEIVWVMGSRFIRSPIPFYWFERQELTVYFQ